ncbi:MAG TPA: hypothetical protein VGD67_25525, partial [Pseudonocardiaceae bacterium]
MTTPPAPPTEPVPPSASPEPDGPGPVDGHPYRGGPSALAVVGRLAVALVLLAAVAGGLWGLSHVGRDEDPRRSQVPAPAITPAA